MQTAVMAIPSRGRCIQPIDHTSQCRCEWFTEQTSPLLNQFSCAVCGHGIHSHVDYVSTTVCHNVTTNCAAHAQKTPLTQRCTCSIHLADHIPILNPYRLSDPSSILDLFKISVQAQTDGPRSSFCADPNAVYIPSAPLTSRTPFPPTSTNASSLPDDAENITHSRTNETTQNVEQHEFPFRYYVPR
ncbi:uncharacterized protein EV420DRAFT_849693 [Desarmillaria tabescens]|uniref:Uncharacterized protein n=1 Tax=Armillaria tabescens TaxID=1929756 RepID=A0AA39JST0_ARMTA|nr:uncharacterized protein EV420DRAFT_849693 [Desarmillaria tabescens]KAK0448267.1 hypothetical protein EV420DRAFT_849693 [Desarmillaria tabescens]